MNWLLVGISELLKMFIGLIALFMVIATAFGFWIMLAVFTENPWIIWPTIIAHILLAAYLLADEKRHRGY